jgi:hypothetical protein
LYIAVANIICPGNRFQKLLWLSIALQNTDVSTMSERIGEIKVYNTIAYDLQCFGDTTGLIYPQSDGYQLLLINHCTGDKVIYPFQEQQVSNISMLMITSRILDLPLTFLLFSYRSSQVRLRLYQEHFILVYFMIDEVILSVYPMPDRIKGRSSGAPSRQSSAPFSFEIKDTTPADMELPEAVETLRLSVVPGSSVTSSCFIGESDNRLDMALSIGARVYKNGQEKCYTYIVRLPHYIIAPNSSRVAMTPYGTGLPENPTALELARSRLTMTHARVFPWRPSVSEAVDSLTSSAASRMLWAECTFPAGASAVMHVYTLRSDSVVLPDHAVREDYLQQLYSAASDESPDENNDDWRSDLLYELPMPGSPDNFLISLRVWYNEHLGRIVLPYLELEESGENGEIIWMLRTRVWNVDTECD